MRYCIFYLILFSQLLSAQSASEETSTISSHESVVTSPTTLLTSSSLSQEVSASSNQSKESTLDTMTTSSESVSIVSQPTSIQSITKSSSVVSTLETLKTSEASAKADQVVEIPVSSSSVISPDENVIFRARPTNTLGNSPQLDSANFIMVEAPHQEAPARKIVSVADEQKPNVPISSVSEKSDEPAQPLEDMSNSEKSGPNETIENSDQAEILPNSFVPQAPEANMDTQNPQKHESQSATVIGAIIGIVLLAIGGIVFYKVSPWRKPASPSNQMKDDNLDLRYSFDTSENLVRNSDASTTDFTILADNKHFSITSEKTHIKSMAQQDHSELQLNDSSFSSRVNSDFLGTPEEKSEILDIARSAQAAAMTAGYLKSKYQGHESIVSFDSLA